MKQTFEQAIEACESIGMELTDVQKNRLRAAMSREAPGNFWAEVDPESGAIRVVRYTPYQYKDRLRIRRADSHLVSDPKNARKYMGSIGEDGCCDLTEKPYARLSCSRERVPLGSHTEIMVTGSPFESAVVQINGRDFDLSIGEVLELVPPSVGIYSVQLMDERVYAVPRRYTVSCYEPVDEGGGE